jgi:hypothetical protein
MEGLVAKLPPEGERYTHQQRQRWLETAKNILDLVYGDGDDEPEPIATSLNRRATVYAHEP